MLRELLQSADFRGTPANTEVIKELLPANAHMLFPLYSAANGMRAFSGALTILPLSKNEDELTLQEWNAQDTWKFEFGGAIPRFISFGHDLFGDQFCIFEDAVCRMDVETGLLTPLASNLEDWCKLIISDPDRETGRSFLKEWNTQSKQLQRDEVLRPKVPFVLGGDYSVQNCFAMARIEALRSCGHIAKQIANLPDGARLKLEVLD